MRSPTGRLRTLKQAAQGVDRPSLVLVTHDLFERGVVWVEAHPGCVDRERKRSRHDLRPPASPQRDVTNEAGRATGAVYDRVRVADLKAISVESTEQIGELEQLALRILAVHPNDGQRPAV